ncbi:hypothetical protein [Kineococcus glutinatus]|uniref:Uncharacterized protein n=1 Tax=Kineococcus glutinatus TaxID=1070872 RepID=A0ABP9HNV4_9ACTN
MHAVHHGDPVVEAELDDDSDLTPPPPRPRRPPARPRAPRPAPPPETVPTTGLFVACAVVLGLLALAWNIPGIDVVVTDVAEALGAA